MSTSTFHFWCVFVAICGTICDATLATFGSLEELTKAVDIYLDWHYDDNMQNTNVTVMNEILEKYGEINSWDVSTVEDFSRLFSTDRNRLAANFTADLSHWDVGNARNMNEMFMNASLFDSDLTTWNVNKVTSFQGLFKAASSFTGQGLDKWDVSSAVFMKEMFFNATSFDSDLTTWQVDQVTHFQGLFKGASKFIGQGIETWNVSSASALSEMFSGATSFDSDLSAWNVNQVTNFHGLFREATNFTGQGVDKWDVSSALVLSEMFSGATSFDSNLVTWQVDQVTNFQGLFNEATSFTGQGLEQWNVSSGMYFMIMFAETKSLRKDLDLRKWQVGNAERMGAMFRNSTFGLDDGSSTNALCPWMELLRPHVDTEYMFAGSNCPHTSDPDLTSVEEGTSFCVRCIGIPTQTSASTSSSSSSPTKKANDASSTTSTSTGKKKPNILLIMTDQQRFDTIQRVQKELSHYSNTTTIRTPNLDKISRMGAFFTNAYTQCPVCGPARTSLRTGCTIERTGVQSNGLAGHFQGTRVFDARVRNLVGIDHILSKVGYSIEYYGKWHMPIPLHQDDNDTSVIQFNDYNYETNLFSFWDSKSNPKFQSYWDYFNQLGLISKELLEGQQEDTYSLYPYKPNMIDSRYGYPTGTSLSAENGFKKSELGQDSVCGEFGMSHHYTPSKLNGETSRKSLERLLRDNDENGKPFFLTVSFHNPHPPMVAASKYLKFYMEHQDTLPISPTIHERTLNSGYSPATSEKLPRYGDEQAVRQWTAVYYALVEEIDDYIGMLLETLGDSIDDTLLIFTSDHGEMLGAHGRRGKAVFYEESVHIPLFISYPPYIKPGTIVEENVSHLDVVATILDYLDLSAEDVSDGTSLRKFIEKKAYNEHYDEDVVVSEWDFRDPDMKDPQNVILSKHLGSKMSFMVRKGQYKLMMRKKSSLSDVDVLYDLSTDPFEATNLVGLNSETASNETISKAEHMRCLLIDWMERMDDGAEYNQPVRYYSDPEANYGEGQGDMKEIQVRQSWPALDVWISDTKIYLGIPRLIKNDDGSMMMKGNNIFRRREYLYVGTRTVGNKMITSIQVEGKDRNMISIDKNELLLVPFECNCIAITFTIQQQDEEGNPFKLMFNGQQQEVKGEGTEQGFIDVYLSMQIDGFDEAVKIPIVLASSAEQSQ